MGNAASSPALDGKVVCAVDDSSVSADTVSWAARTLVLRNKEVHLVQVLDSTAASQADYNSGEGGVLPSGGKAEADTRSVAASAAFLARLRDTLLAEAGVQPAAVKLVPLSSATATSGDVGRTITDYAAEQGADAVVIGSRGLGAFRRRFMGLLGLGSVSEYVAHRAPCTVFIHRAA